jgi:hypothetical protein
MSNPTRKFFDARIEVGQTVYYPTAANTAHPSAQVKAAQVVALPAPYAEWLILKPFGEPDTNERTIAGLSARGVFTASEVAELVPLDEHRAHEAKGASNLPERVLTDSDLQHQTAQRLARAVIARASQQEAYMTGAFEEMTLAGQPMTAAA